MKIYNIFIDFKRSVKDLYYLNFQIAKTKNEQSWGFVGSFIILNYVFSCPPLGVKRSNIWID